ncbi:MAG: TIGR00730 family Rossman fold protein [Bacteroidales bacterium]|nr:TIGR00730 family Rossman fold protein [Bacteroidales bacterium]
MNVAVFCGSGMPNNPLFKQDASLLGEAIAKMGHTLVYGGSNLGLMGAVSAAALNDGGTVVGVIPTLFGKEVIASQKVSRLVEVSSMSERKDYMVYNSDAFIVLAGGIGTLDELSEVMVGNQLGLIEKPVIVLNSCGFYNHLMQQMDLMKTEGLLHKSCMLHVVNSVDECVAVLKEYETGI